ncbi:hypothetical protein [Magnetospirillum sp. UT-4]|uniref:hypothetical protein n=1 Tax=Magnetospirillum sp. UT-4 TaxID=2681467 RepID=UPI0013836B36|nr:hypothetical protein [Magnetospirillum sp. UT-4]CAA7619871.1 conserved exported hypothetical protein [Magnetospirillum sp. UT-4]
MPHPVRAAFLLLLLLSAVAPPALAQAKFSRCLQQDEVVVEQIIRHGIFLREAGGRCEDYQPGTAKKWTDFDAKNGARLKKQTERRIKVFQREFKADALKVMTYFDGRLVTYHRHYPLSAAYCRNVDKMLDAITKGGWGAFAEQASTVQNQVLQDYKVC